ncbi:MAG TPA: M10 family metallopeptidase C-terminal domain-containing protein [Rhizomicrobium sp.]|nr:M10 family metallopeptidase C-terminal domain-containing protein [Rhizomicrobium sp.]
MPSMMKLGKTGKIGARGRDGEHAPPNATDAPGNGGRGGDGGAGQDVAAKPIWPVRSGHDYLAASYAGAGGQGGSGGNPGGTSSVEIRTDSKHVDTYHSPSADGGNAGAGGAGGDAATAYSDIAANLRDAGSAYVLLSSLAGSGGGGGPSADGGANNYYVDNFGIDGYGQPFQYVDHGLAGGLGGNGGNGGAGGAAYTSLDGGKFARVLALRLNLSAEAGTGGTGSTGGLGGAGSIGGNGGRGGNGGHGGDAIAEISGNAIAAYASPSAGSSQIEFDLLALAGNGGSAGEGGDGGRGAQLTIYSNALDPSQNYTSELDTPGVAGRGGRSGDGGDAIVNFTNNTITGHDGNDRIDFVIQATAGNAGAVADIPGDQAGSIGHRGHAIVNFSGNVIAGGGGVNTMDFSGSDVDLTVDLGTGSINGGINTIRNINVVIGGNEHNTLTGSAHRGETLEGGIRDDTLVSSPNGGDIFENSPGNDSFVFLRVGDSPASHPDTIEGLTPGRNTIDLSAISPDLVHVAKLDGHPDEFALIYIQSHNMTKLAVDTDGDKVADMIVLLPGDNREFSDFIV